MTYLHSLRTDYDAENKRRAPVALTLRELAQIGATADGGVNRQALTGK